VVEHTGKGVSSFISKFYSWDIYLAKDPIALANNGLSKIMAKICKWSQQGSFAIILSLLYMDYVLHAIHQKDTFSPDGI
jgi:hypothetical protein